MTFTYISRSSRRVLTRELRGGSGAGGTPRGAGGMTSRGRGGLPRGRWGMTSLGKGAAYNVTRVLDDACL